MKKAGFLNNELDRWRIFSAAGFFILVLLLAWQSDDAYHGYVMSRNLAEGHGLVYNIGERSTASTCPLFTLIIALFYFITREMYFTSIMVCALFSLAAYLILVKKLCRTKEQVIICFITLTGSISFMSYTTSGLENSLLFFLSGLFLLSINKKETYDAKALFIPALILSFLAMARMDSVLIFVPFIVWIYLFKRDNVSFIKAVFIGLAGLLPFILWELFAVFYFGFPFPNPAYVKLGSGIAVSEYLKRGIIYGIVTGLNDLTVIAVPATVVILTLISKRLKYILLSAGIVLYLIYIIRIGGDFMMGRHFTNLLYVSLGTGMMLNNEVSGEVRKTPVMRKALYLVCFVSVVFSLTFGHAVGSQFLGGHMYGSHITDEREYYFGTTGFFNNALNLVRKGELLISKTWNNEAADDIRANGLNGGIVDNAAGIFVYYNPDLYLNDTFALGDPFLSKLPAEYVPNWRVGHLRREIPHGYKASIWFNENRVEDPDLHEYYDKIRLITRGELFAEGRIKTIIDMNLGKYSYLIKNYEERRKVE